MDSTLWLAVCDAAPTLATARADLGALDRIMEKDVLVPIILGGVAIVWIIFATLAKVVGDVSRERTRREIAAYIAEGSMTPEQGERLMKAKPKEHA